MARIKNKTSNSNNNSSNSTQERALRKIRIDNLNTFAPKTENQSKTYKSYSNNKNLLLHGIAGTGKTFISLYLSLEQVLDPSTEYKRVAIVRSVVPTRDIGFLKGDDKEKISVYEAPYKAICEELFGIKEAYEALKQQGALSFISTSFIRGSTFNDTIIIVDEFENLNFHELDSIITRVGQNCKIIFCGDHSQTDLTKEAERQGLPKFMRILKSMKNFDFIEFGIDDIVRSALVKEYIITKYNLGIDS
jgi:phosphate starvation-inducible PhoH-like protein